MILNTVYKLVFLISGVIIKQKAEKHCIISIISLLSDIVICIGLRRIKLALLVKRLREVRIFSPVFILDRVKQLDNKDNLF